MITLQELSTDLDILLDVGSFQDYCPNGLQIEGRGKVKRVATAVTASQSTIEATIKGGYDALIVHHGFFFRGEEPSIVGPKYRRVKALIESGVSLLAYHLPLDAHVEIGNNWRAAADLGLTGVVPFGESSGKPIGVLGVCEPTSIAAWITRLEEYYGQKAHVALGGGENVGRVAILSGSGYRHLSEAKRKGADLFVTGNFDEPAWHVAFEETIHFAALGHTSTEKVGPKALAAYIKRRFGVEADFLDLPNPF